MNKTSAEEWVIKAWHDFSSAEILYNADHYTDVIGVELHYAIEKLLKAFLAYENQKIKKSHNLIEIYVEVQAFISLNDEELDLLKIVTDYHKDEVYPIYSKPLPEMDEIKKVLNFTLQLFNEVCKLLDIDVIKKQG